MITPKSVPDLLRVPVPAAPNGQQPGRILVCGVLLGVNHIVHQLHVRIAPQHGYYAAMILFGDLIAERPEIPPVGTWFQVVPKGDRPEEMPLWKALPENLEFSSLSVYSVMPRDSPL